MATNYSALIIDSNSTTRKALASIIRKYFPMREIHAGQSGRDAIALLKKSEKIDWIFCDSDITDKSVFELIDEAKNNPCSEKAKFVLLTSKTDREFLLEASSAGVTTFIVKPFTPKTVIEKVKHFIDGKTLRAAPRIQLLEAVAAKIIFPNGEYDANLIDISSGGCMVKSTVFSKEGCTIYDTATINIPFNDTAVELTAELIRMERNMESEGKFITAAFIFKAMNKDAAMKFKDLFTMLSKHKKHK